MVCVFSPELTSSEVERRCHGVCLLSGVLHHLVGFPFQEKEGCEKYFLPSICFINVSYWISSNSSMICIAQFFFYFYFYFFYFLFFFMYSIVRVKFIINLGISHVCAFLSFCGRFQHSDTHISLSPLSFPASCIRGVN